MLGDLGLAYLAYFLAGAAGAGAAAGAAAVTGATKGGGALQGAGSGVPATRYFMATALIDWQSWKPATALPYAVFAFANSAASACAGVGGGSAAKATELASAQAALTISRFILFNPFLIFYTRAHGAL